MYYVYLLSLTNKETYVGFTEDLKRRYHEHQTGQDATTKRFLPCELIGYTAFKSKHKALAFEKYLKSGSGFAFRNRHLIGI
ncbi:MAG: GIY-YIG nuclease family protein [Patescibacteria group bacterium]|nr:GIY-YIG nuclease family protein [Patescibacteria group bacterium]MCL5432214.1 GIY-YIG nuclease family protein [Patescibacteria group bacterium]